MSAKNIELSFHIIGSPLHVACLTQPGDGAECHLLPAAGNQDRRMRPLHRLGLKNGIFHVEISAVLFSVHNAVGLFKLSRTRFAGQRGAALSARPKPTA
jgi:hypothetical protein